MIEMWTVKVIIMRVQMGMKTLLGIRLDPFLLHHKKEFGYIFVHALLILHEANLKNDGLVYLAEKTSRQ
jgi:hypothetical protein